MLNKDNMVLLFCNRQGINSLTPVPQNGETIPDTKSYCQKNDADYGSERLENNIKKKGSDRSLMARWGVTVDAGQGPDYGSLEEKRLVL